jgi:hypothetical protein
VSEPGENEVPAEAVSDDDDQYAGVTIEDDDPERARRIAAAFAVDSDEASPVATSE